MREVKNSVRSRVRVGFDGLVHKEFRGTGAKERFENEVRVLTHLEKVGCAFVPKVVEADEDELILVTTNCGQIVTKMSQAKQDAIFAELEEEYGVRHDDAFLRNITYSDQVGRFCVIDFELATIVTPAADRPAPD